MLSTDLQYLIDEYRVLARLFAFLAISSTIFLYYRYCDNADIIEARANFIIIIMMQSR